MLAGKCIALLFEKPSLRTRMSFELAVHQLGGYAIYMSPDEVGLGKRESVPDVAHVLSRYVQGIVARTFLHRTLETLAEYRQHPGYQCALRFRASLPGAGRPCHDLRAQG